MVSHAGDSYSFLLPPQHPESLPEWIQVHQPDPAIASTFASWEFAIKAPEGSGDLAVTFCFTEKEGSFLKVYWQGATEAVTLCDTLYEGVAMPNQRTLLIPKSVIGSGGTLTVLAGTSDAGISSVEWSWVTPATVGLAGPGASAPSLLRAGSQALRAEEVSGNALQPSGDQIVGNTVAAVLQDEPIRIEQGVTFVASLEEVPPLARVEVQLLGVPLNRNLALWVNGVPVNQVSLDVPDLLTPGYTPAFGPNGKAFYTGWRKGTVFLPASVLHTGENFFRFDWVEPDATESTPTPLALKNFYLQLNFESASASAPTATNQP